MINFSSLPVEVQVKAMAYQSTNWVTFAKPVLPDFVRFAIANFSEIDQMQAEGWLVIDMTN